MVQLEEQENPTFESVTEPEQLQRPHCDQCRVAIADYECQRCVQRFCMQCELMIHHRLEGMAMKLEESKGDGRPHQEYLKWIRGCQECGAKKLEFFCVNCNMYECESCCASKHVQLEPHFFFCVEGSSPKLISFASWNVMFVEMVKVSKGVLQDIIAVTEASDTLASQTATESDNTSAIKLERVVTATSTNATAAALGNLTIDGVAGTPQPAEQKPKRQAKLHSRANITSTVDLTLDDDSDASSSSALSHLPAQPRIKVEAQDQAKNAWLTSAVTTGNDRAFDVDELMEKTMGEDEDPVLRSMVGEYNQLSSGIFGIDQKVDGVRKRTKELSSVQPIDMLEVNKTRVMANKLRREKLELEKTRDGVVANIVYYLKSDPDELREFLQTCTAEVSYAQTACHRKCATLEASIRHKLENIGRIQRDIMDLINMKKDAFAEVARLGADIVLEEEGVRKLDKERQVEFLRLCQFSKAIQTAVREMARS